MRCRSITRIVRSKIVGDGDCEARCIGEHLRVGIVLGQPRKAVAAPDVSVMSDVEEHVPELLQNRAPLRLVERCGR